MRPTPEQQRDLDSRYYHTGLEELGISFNHEPTDPRTDHISYDITTPIMPAHPSSCADMIATSLYLGRRMTMLNSEEYIPCKLTDKNGYTKNQTLWGENITHEVTGSSNQALCSNRWIHFYEHPLIAVFMNPVHARFNEPRLYSCLIEGEIKKDGQLKSGCKKLTTLSRLPLPVITSEQRIEIGIRCAMIVYKEQHWSLWAQKWLSGEDRTEKSADATDAAAYAAARDAAYDAAYAAYAANAATIAVISVIADTAAIDAAYTATFTAAIDAAYAAAAYAAARDAAFTIDADAADADTYAAYAAYAAQNAAYDAAPVIPLLRIIKEVLKLQ